MLQAESKQLLGALHSRLVHDAVSSKGVLVPLRTPAGIVFSATVACRDAQEHTRLVWRAVHCASAVHKFALFLLFPINIC